MTDTANLLAVDMSEGPKKQNEFAVVKFDEVFGEPDNASKSVRCVWNGSRKCHDTSMNICYKILGIMFGFPIAFCCGLIFACLSFTTIWCVKPCIRALKIWLMSLKVCHSTGLRCILDPFWQSCGLLFNNVRANIKHDRDSV